MDHQSILDSGGTIAEGTVLLKNIPANKFPEGVLLGTSDRNIKYYWIIHANNTEPKAYVTDRIIKENELLFDVYIKRFKSITLTDLRRTLGLEEDLNQQEVDNRIMSLVKKGALKASSSTDSSHFVFSKSFALSLPNEGDYLIFDRDSSGLKLNYSREILKSPIGAVPNIIDPSNNGGPWGIRFDDSEFSTDALERIIDVPVETFPYDSANHEYEKTFTILGSATILYEYVQVRESDQQRSGRFFATWPGGSTNSGLNKEIKALRVKVGSNPAVDIPVSRDTSVGNAFALKSERLTQDPVGLAGSGPVSMSINIVFTDDTVAYGNNGTEFNPVATDMDMKYSWDTLAGLTEDSLQQLVTVEKYHHDFETNSGFDIELNNFNFLTSITGVSAVRGNSNRMKNINVCRLSFVLTRHDGHEWNPGTYRCKVHRQKEGITPYLHDFQFKRGITD